MAKEIIAEKKQEPKFPLEILRANSTEIFGVPDFVFDGATCKLKDKEYTKDSIKKTIDEWLKKEAG